jgi:transcriptional regulator with XRE-family HTH domain
MITRIRELLETRQLTPTQFADLIGVGRPVISHILSERNKPSLEVVQKIIGAFPEVSLPWLLTGTGSMQASGALDTSLAAPVVAPVAPPALMPPQPAAPTPIYSPPPALQTLNSVAAVVAPVARPTPLPLPPKFRPGIKAAPHPTSSSLGPTPTLPSPSVSVETPAPAAASLPEIAAAATQIPAETAPVPAPTPAPVIPPPIATSPNTLPTADNLSTGGMPALAQTPSPVSTAMVKPATTSPAAALSFLGEPGKSIRRIVIFYRDGSFSDYVPEGL